MAEGEIYALYSPQAGGSDEHCKVDGRFGNKNHAYMRKAYQRAAPASFKFPHKKDNRKRDGYKLYCKTVIVNYGKKICKCFHYPPYLSVKSRAAGGIFILQPPLSKINTLMQNLWRAHNKIF